MSAKGRDPALVKPPAEFFATPAWCVRRLLERVELPGGRWLEPAAGDGAIIRAVNEQRSDLQWTAIDIREECRAPLLEAGVADVRIGNFLATPMPHERWSCAVLNPPFTHALEFVQRCLLLADLVVMLERINWLGGEERHPWLAGHVPDIYTLPNRPSFTGEGTDATEYAWMRWSRAERSRGAVEMLGLTSATERAEDKARVARGTWKPSQCSLFATGGQR